LFVDFPEKLLNLAPKIFDDLFSTTNLQFSYSPFFSHRPRFKKMEGSKAKNVTFFTIFL